MRETGDMPGRDRAMHALNRLAFGPRPGDAEFVRNIGVEEYIRQQLHPEMIPIPEGLVRKVAGYRTLHMTPMALFLEYWRPVMQARHEIKRDNGDDKGAIKDALKAQRIVLEEAVEARLLRAIEGPRQLQEVMTHFWFNHFNVFAGKGLDHIWTGSFEQDAIRPNTMGKFRTLLAATARHPAMLFYLDNWQNTAPGSPGAKGKFEGINENYARELMELHTLGVNGGYSQQDVIALARILTGWGIPKGDEEARRKFSGQGMGRFAGRYRRWGTGMPAIPASGFYFDPDRHDSSDKTLLGHRIGAGGAQEGEQALDILARHPSTANHLSYQLAQYFVADDPPRRLVERMAQRYLSSDGDIRAVLETMFSAPEFWDRACFGAKFKTPYEYVISSVRLSGVAVRNYRPLAGTMAMLGMPPYGCQTPNGYASVRDAWLNPDAMMRRLSFATGLGTGNLPLERPPDEHGPELAAGDHPERPAQKMPPLEPGRLAAALGADFTASTSEAIAAADPKLRAALILGSPEFMTR